jgi:phosphatidylinositol glycan class Z
VRALALDICWGAAVFLAASATIVVVDSLYFGTATLTYTSSTPDGAVAMAPLALLRHVLLGGGGGGGGHPESGGFADRMRGVGVAPGSHLTLTPLNSYRYNSVVENLAQHGLHPRWTHAVVNMPMMFGPIALLGLLELCRSIRQKITEGGTGQGGAKTAMATSVAAVNLRVVLGAIVVLYFAGLSTAPHQEARFLLPLLLPVVILYGAQIFGSGTNDAASTDSDASPSASKRGSKAGRGASPSPGAPRQRRQLVGLLQVACVVFNTAICIFFGGLHQAGVSRALISIAAAGSGSSSSDGGGSWAAGSSVVFFHTYIPPVALTAQPVPTNATAAAAAVDVKIGRAHV